MTIVWVGVVLTLLLFLVGVPIFAALGIGAIILSILAFELPPANIGEMLVSGANSYSLLAFPLYILMGELFLEGGCAKALVKFINILVGRVSGGLGIASVATAGFFLGHKRLRVGLGGHGGHDHDTGNAEGQISRWPGRRLRGLLRHLGESDPPSLFLIMYGAMCEVNVATLFAAGLIPGLLAVGVISATVYIICSRTNYEMFPETTWGEKWRITRQALPAIFMPFFVLGSIYTGMATPTEAGAVAVFYSLFLGFFVYHGLKPGSAWQATRRALLTTGAIMIMVAAGIVIARLFVLAGFPEAINNLVMQSNMSKLTYLFLSGVCIIILGTFIETVLMIYICVPLFYPTAMELGVDPIHFGIFLVVGVIVGHTTPTMAESIFITSSVSNIPSGEMMKYITPFVISLAVVFVFTIIFPELSTALPRGLGLMKKWRAAD